MLVGAQRCWDGQVEEEEGGRGGAAAGACMLLVWAKGLQEALRAVRLASRLQ